ncbi:MAG: hypothetical protein ACFFC7_23145 [Candidatus Hermodarchaeota archaeon]
MLKQIKIGIILLLVVFLLTNSQLTDSLTLSETQTNPLKMKNNYNSQQPQTPFETSESKPKSPDALVIKQKGINFAGYPHPTVLWPKFGDAAEPEHPVPYWCSLAYNYTYILEDFYTLKKLGVEHIRLRAEIFQFMIWDVALGYQGFNQTYVSNLKQVFELAGSLGFEVTYCMMSWINYTHAHPSYTPFMESFLPTDNTSSAIPLYPVRLNNIIKAFGDLVAVLKNYPSIHTWEIMNEAESFFWKSSCHWNYSLDYIFLPIRQSIRTADSERPVVVSSVNLKNFTHPNPLWWYDNICDYYDGHYYNNTGILPDPSVLTKPVVLGELGGDWKDPSPPESVLYKLDRRENVYVLNTIWNTFRQKGYDSFMPWEFAENYVQSRSNPVIGQHQHCWTWNALVLYSFYIDGVDFLDTNYYVTMIGEPTFDGEFMFFKMFLPTPQGNEPPPPPPPNVITTTLRTMLPFHGIPIEGDEGIILNTYFPSGTVPDSKIPSGDYFNTTIYGLMDCIQLPIDVTANTIETLNFTEYNSQRLVVRVLTGEEVVTPSKATQDKWIALTIGNYPKIIEGSEQFIIEAGQMYQITSKDLHTGYEESWEEIASPEGVLELNLTLISTNQQVTVTKIKSTIPSNPTGVGEEVFCSIVIITMVTILLTIRKKRRRRSILQNCYNPPSN